MGLKPSRRQFLLIGTAALVALGLQRLPLWRRLNIPWLAGLSARRQVASLATLVRQRLDYLNLSQRDLETFARDFQAREDTPLMGLATENPTRFAEQLTLQFLLSTDFFLNGADESRPVSYRTYYDPYEGCSNPFAEFD